MLRRKLPKRAERVIARFRAQLTRRYPDATAYLFGSYANGTWLEDSDFDVLVLSNHFRGQSLEKRVAAVRRLAPRNSPFEILPYTPDEFREASRRSITIQDALTYWRRIV